MDVLITIGTYFSLALIVWLAVPTWGAGALMLLRIPPLLSYSLVWLLLSYFWNLLEGGPIPLLALGGAFLWAGWTSKIRELTDGGWMLAGAEMWSIVATAAVVMFIYEEVRWV